jgi:hypothetical protein
MVNRNCGVSCGINGTEMLAVACVGVNIMATATKQGQCRVISCPASLLFTVELKLAKLVNDSGK